MKIFPPACALLLSLASLLPCQAQPNAVREGKPDFTRARQFIQERIVTYTIPSISVAVARRGKILWEEGFGWADRENRIPATEHTMYQTASLTKLMTSTSVMILQERKQLDLDRPVNDYLGSGRLSSPAWDPAAATVRRVATHTAGLTNYDEGWSSDMDPRPSADEIIRRYGVIFWRPGEQFDYSNLGYGVLGQVIARVSRRRYAEFLRDEVFWPLGMTHSSAAIGPDLEKFVAARYQWYRGRLPWTWGEPVTPGYSGVFCSAHDLALFGMFHLKAHLPNQKAILSDAAIDAMQNSTVAADNGQRYGLGWWIDEDHFGYRDVSAGGGNYSASATLKLIPSEGIAVAVLCNTGIDREAIIDEVLSVLLPPYREKRARAAGSETPSPPEANPTSSPTNLPPSLTGNWTGGVQTPQGKRALTLSIAASGDVHAKLESQLGTLLNDVQFSKRRLTGRMSGDLEDDLIRPPYELNFYLDLRGEVLNGAVTASGTGPRLSYWVELRKQ